MSGLYASDGGLNVTLVGENDLPVSVYAADGSLRVTQDAGLGFYAPNGAIRIAESSIAYSPSGAWGGTLVGSVFYPSSYGISASVVPVVPTILLSTTTVAESATIGAIVGSLSVNTGGSYTFTITADPDNKFDISGSNLVTTAALDYETATSHSVTVQADNGLDAPVSKTFTVIVTDEEEPSVVLNFRGVSQNNNATAATDIVIPVPSGTLPGDILVCVVSRNNGNAVNHNSTYFTKRFESSDGKLRIYTHRVEAGDPSSYTFSLLSPGTAASVVMLSYESNLDMLSFLAAQGAGQIPSLTLTQAPAIIIGTVFATISRTITGMTERASIPQSGGQIVADTFAGTTGVKGPWSLSSYATPTAALAIQLG